MIFMNNIFTSGLEHLDTTCYMVYTHQQARTMRSSQFPTLPRLCQDLESITFLIGAVILNVLCKVTQCL